MNDLRKEDWHNWGRWVQPTLSGAFWSRWSEAPALGKMFPEVDIQPVLFLDGHTFLPRVTEQSFSDLVDKMFAENSFAAMNTALDMHSRTSEEQHLSLLDGEGRVIEQEPKEYLEKLFATYAGMLGPWIGSVMLSHALEEYVLEKEIVSSEEEMVEKVKPYWRYTWLEEQAQEMNIMARKLVEAGHDKDEDISQFPKIAEKFQAHLTEFDWFGTHHWVGEQYDEEKASSDLHRTIAKGNRAETEAVPKDQNDALADLWQLLASCIYWRTHAAEVTAKVVFRSRPVLSELAKSWNITYEELTWLSSREIMAALKTDSREITFPENFAERKAGYGANVDDENVEKIIVGEDLRASLDQVMDVVDENLTEIRGVTASRGPVVTGTVKVLITPEDVYKFEAGDVLVAPETAPDYVPAMKKASAVVTEVGGITSHAAIVSRELGVPCIIGTKIATQVLKDGMEVEVDADRGVVKILS